MYIQYQLLVTTQCACIYILLLLPETWSYNILAPINACIPPTERGEERHHRRSHRNGRRVSHPPHLMIIYYYIIFMTHRDPPLATSSDPLHPLYYIFPSLMMTYYIILIK